MMRRGNGVRMTIGQVARQAGVAATTLRFYERAGLLSPTERSGSGYRLYDEDAVARLAFIRAAQDIGFTLEDIRALLALNGRSTCQQVRVLIQGRLADIDQKLANLRRVRRTLADALRRCHQCRKGCTVVAGLKGRRAQA